MVKCHKEGEECLAQKESEREEYFRKREEENRKFKQEMLELQKACDLRYSQNIEKVQTEINDISGTVQTLEENFAVVKSTQNAVVQQVSELSDKMNQLELNTKQNLICFYLMNLINGKRKSNTEDIEQLKEEFCMIKNKVNSKIPKDTENSSRFGCIPNDCIKDHNQDVGEFSVRNQHRDTSLEKKRHHEYRTVGIDSDEHSLPESEPFTQNTFLSPIEIENSIFKSRQFPTEPISHREVIQIQKTRLPINLCEMLVHVPNNDSEQFRPTIDSIDIIQENFSQLNGRNVRYNNGNRHNNSNNHSPSNGSNHRQSNNRDSQSRQNLNYNNQNNRNAYNQEWLQRIESKSVISVGSNKFYWNHQMNQTNITNFLRQNTSAVIPLGNGAADVRNTMYNPQSHNVHVMDIVEEPRHEPNNATN
ncbi:ankyrin repeat and ELMO domain-containing protein D-like [Schistocerca serialis cubense]|uniref:ankyrin repeat and ELMO domain-containing protein D-like n=1 Tax=Schistocerca serialis cubense TaxID=2023355 RepID=UPI00214E9D5C|nr:ankyrin repeat and ELMO domain-containing protein D-like [Schistocerca serialis cubense]